MTVYERDDLIRRLKYSSIYNTPCPEWVYKMIAAMPTNPAEEIIPAPEGDKNASGK